MRNTLQRDAIYKVVAESCDHPKADTIFERVRKVIPDISLGTVYRNLALLSETGKIRRIPVIGEGDRFDKTIRFHSHLSCKCCKRVLDIDDEIEEKLLPWVENRSGCRIEDAELLYIGICRDCLEQQ